MSDGALLIAPVLIPLIGAAVAMLLRNRPDAARITGGVAIAVMTVASMLLLSRVVGTGVLPVMRFGGWPAGFAVSFVGDTLAALLTLVTGLVGTAAALFAHADVRARRRRAGFDAMLLALLGSVNGAFLTGDLFNLYVWFELALVAALSLITIDRARAAIDGAIRYATLSIAGASLILLGVGLVYGSTGTLDLATLGAILGDQPPVPATAVAGALMLAGFGLKAGLVPFHSWLTASYHSAPIAVSAVLAGLLTKMGFYALMRVMVAVYGIGAEGSGGAMYEPMLATIAILTMVGCALAALGQTDMRRILAWHVIAQVGYMAMGLAVATRAGLIAAIFYMVHSMLVQANLFLGAGVIHRATGSWGLRRAGGTMRTNPSFALLFAVPVLSLAGIPPLSGFWAKITVIRAGLGDGALMLVLAAFGAAMLTIVSMAAFWSEALWKAPPRGHRTRPVPAAMLWGMAVLSVGTVAISLQPHRLLALAQLSASALTMNVGGAR
ncbi:multicomponent Na+:H+ antiporter subunit D [Sphingomonas jejuensis]|uniref:Multicomponent Na+:H+ antiporter subunit D n=1 Tax=Sphingomonas jejuensis TaxID=904715 RepID=A0ABX0XK49_9SPHN|nr:multicomponent Na+:H+ antiporter subunit D [Sphingomonas jejuensis]